MSNKSIYPTKPPINLKTVMTAVLLIALGWGSYVQTNISLVKLFTGIPQMGQFFLKMIPPDFGYLDVIYKPMMETIQMAIIGTTLGALMAFPISFFAASNVTGFAILRVPARMILNLCRTIPDLLFAAIFAAIFGYGAIAGTLALTFFSFGVLAKWSYELIETIDRGPLEAMTASGASKVQWIQYGVLPQLIPQMIGYFLYMFEINIRSAAILGIVGAGGIGLYLNRTLGMFRYDQTAAIILATLVIVLVIDAISSWIRGKLV